MKLTGRDAQAHLARPDPAMAGTLLFGPDPMRISLKRKALIETLIGPDGAADLRLTRLGAGDVRKDPAMLRDALKAVGFFDGPRAVWLDEANEHVADAVRAALKDWRKGDAHLVVTAGNLTPRNALRKTFEAAKTACAVGVYADPPGREEVARAVSQARLARVAPEAMRDIEDLAGVLDPGDFAQFLEKLALYTHGAPGEVTPADVAACAPPAPEAELDVLIALVAEGRASEIARAFARLRGQESRATSLTIAAARHFRTLHAAALAEEGADAALAKARPPVFGPRRRQMAGQVRALGPANLEQALVQILDTERRLRSGRGLPMLAMVERLFIRLASLKRQ